MSTYNAILAYSAILIPINKRGKLNFLEKLRNVGSLIMRLWSLKV